jgi:hypothetical protein
MLIRSKRSWAASVVTQQIEPGEEQPRGLPTGRTALPTQDGAGRPPAMPPSSPVSDLGSTTPFLSVDLCQDSNVFRCGMRCDGPGAVCAG